MLATTSLSSQIEKPSALVTEFMANLSWNILELKSHHFYYSITAWFEEKGKCTSLVILTTTVLKCVACYLYNNRTVLTHSAVSILP